MIEISEKDNETISDKIIKINEISKPATGQKLKTRNSKYKNAIEKRDGKRERNRASYQRSKFRRKVMAGIQVIMESFDGIYRKGIFLGIRGYDYKVMVTLTNHDSVTLKKHNCNIGRLLTWLRDLGLISDIFKIHEHDGFNYHSHILMNINVSVKSITGIIKKYWQKKYGFVDVLKIDDRPMKDRVIMYCLKGLNPSSRNNKKQELVDTWELQPGSVNPQNESSLNRRFSRPMRTTRNSRNYSTPNYIMLEPTPLNEVKNKNKIVQKSQRYLHGIY